MHEIHGVVSVGVGHPGDSLKLLLPEIRRLSGLTGLLPSTLSLRIPQDYAGRADFTIEPSDASLNQAVTLEKCRIRGLDALIVRTSANTHGDRVLEIIAEVWLRQEFGISDGDRETIEVFTAES